MAPYTLAEVRAMDKRARAKAARTKLEDRLAAKMSEAGVPTPKREFKFATRRWRADFAWPDHMLLVEVEGGTYVNGRHNRPQGYEDDCFKYGEAAILGWTVLRVTGKMVTSGQAIDLITRLMEAKGWDGKRTSGSMSRRQTTDVGIGVGRNRPQVTE